jgi:hypothetical protein
MKRLLIALALVAASIATGHAQESSTSKSEKYIELLRSDWKADRTAIVTEALDLTDQQGTAFWPIYRKYDLELSDLNDQRLQLIKDYANQFTTLTDQGASDLMKRAFKLREKRSDLLAGYAGKVNKAVGGRVAARWSQIEIALHSLVDIALASELPLVQ